MECVCRISKAGRNLFARVPEENRNEFGRGDKVKITLIEKAIAIKDPVKLKAEIEEFLNNPHGEKVSGTIMGYTVELPLAKILNAMPKIKARKLLTEVLTE